MGSSMHSVDIIIPTYNYGQFIGQCLESVLAQTFGDYRVLVIDNASEDDTTAVVQHYQQRDARIDYVRNASNIGPAPSVNKAYGMTSARYWVLLCADDYWQPDFLQATVGDGLLAHPQCGFAYSRFSRLVGDRLVAEMAHVAPELEAGVHELMDYLCFSNWIAPSYCVIDRQRYDAVGGTARAAQRFQPPGSLRRGSLGDHYNVARLAARHPGFVVPERLGVYRVHGNSDTVVTGQQLVEEITLLYDQIFFDNDLFSDLHRYLAKVNEMGRILTDSGLARTAFEVARNPRTATLLGDNRRELLRTLVRTLPRMRYDALPGTLRGDGLLERSESLQRLAEIAERPYSEWASLAF
jgi:glycosyltransferase involved in cell wall biosynthesis